LAKIHNFLRLRFKFNPEIIFSTQSLSPTNPTAFTESMDVQIGWYGCINPYQDLVDEFECTDGLPISKSPLYRATTPFANRDPRLVMNMRRVAEETWPDPQHPGQTGYAIRKYVDFFCLLLSATRKQILTRTWSTSAMPTYY
jgi:hypothetical protein